MGGPGSGRHGGFHATTTEDMTAIDLAWLRKEGILSRWGWSTISWSRGGHKYASISIKSEEHGLNLSYSLGEGEDRKYIKEFIPYSYTDANFGGRRQWFRCLSCGRNCRVIYGGQYFRCRHCYGLKYQSQYERSWSRATDKALKIRQKLGCDGGIDDPFPEKPKGMHWKTYYQLEAEYERCYEAWGRLSMEWLGRY